MSDGKIAQSKAAQDTLSLFVLRRDFDTHLPSRPDVTIGSALPPKHHFTVERIFTPSDQRTYDNQFARWQQRLFTSHRNAAGQNVPAVNARSQRASQMIEFFPLIGHLHFESPAEKRPKDEAYGDGNNHLDEKYNRDRESFFYEKSPMYKEFQAISYEKGKASRLRWLLSKIQHFTDELVDAEGRPLDFANMSPTNIAAEFVKRSPKLQAMLSLHMDWCLLRNEKMIFWFNTPILQVLAQEVLEALGYNLFSVYSHNTLEERMRIQRHWNNPETVNRVLLASALVFGTGFNLQKDSRAACLVDTPDSDNREKQIIGRQYRGGQDLPVMFFRLTVRGAHSVVRFQ
ncbi:hypothetical protein SLS59_007209 [Nothophoma quercina]|uniref:Helicase C-terminal domain-containing protein n=1 Tax=Nothophoma quercina TaxID=749835 RepID=A0ABR3R273_9PLEO